MIDTLFRAPDSNTAEIIVVEKQWGIEYWLVNTNLYCAKVLAINAGWTCSLHRHPIKDETFILREGRGFLQIGEVIYPMDPEVSYHIPANTWHRFWTTEGMSLLEVSTHHSDYDVERYDSSSKLDRPMRIQPRPEDGWPD